MVNRIGVNVWTVYGWNPEETLTVEVVNALGAMGSQALELVVDERYNRAELLLEHEPELLAALQATGMEVPSVASALFWRHNLGSQDQAVREKGLGVIEEECRVAKGFGARVILVVAGLQEPRTEYNKTYETVVQTIRKAAEYAEDHGVVIGIENVASNFLCSPREFAQFISDVGRPSVKAYLDVGNAMAIGAGHPENWVSAVKDSIAMVHVKDYSKNSKSFELCGQGDLAWVDTMEALRDAGYGDYLLIETPPDYGRRGQDIAAGLAAARTSLKWVTQFV